MFPTLEGLRCGSRGLLSGNPFLDLPGLLSRSLVGGTARRVRIVVRRLRAAIAHLGPTIAGRARFGLLGARVSPCRGASGFVDRRCLAGAFTTGGLDQYSSFTLRIGADDAAAARVAAGPRVYALTRRCSFDVLVR